ncbi:glycosyltransferase family 4 protein [Alienimonas sp. DA493]|uniref:glycosyltransferase family 4 protein n=1 Tax=Alienimonas sp. DA493 TaxID=3373605 RepID=UPI003754AFD2
MIAAKSAIRIDAPTSVWGKRSEPACDAIRRVRIAHVQLLPLLSGVQRVTLDELERLDPASFDRTLILQSPGPFSEAAEKRGVRVQYAPAMIRAVRPAADWRAYRQLRELFRAGQFDVVHTHSSKPGVLGRMAARAAGVPTIVHSVHGFAFPAAGRVKRAIFTAAERLAATRCDAVVCLNPADAATCTDELKLLAGKVRLLPNGVDPNQRKPLSEFERETIRREAFGVGPEDKVVGMVGRLWPQKDPLTFVDIICRLRDFGEDRTGGPVTGVLIGDGNLRPQVEAAVREAGLNARFRLLGWREDAAKLIAAADVSCLPSRWEGLPLVILEALAAAVPVVASDISGNRDAIEPDGDGLLCPPGDAAAFAEAIRGLLVDDERRAAFGDVARARIREQFDVSDRVRRIVELYRELGAPLGDRDGVLDLNEALGAPAEAPR